MTQPARWAGALGVAGLTLAVHARDLGWPLGGDDIYVLESLRSASWGRRLFAFDVDAPGADYWPWWTGVVVQRRYIRVPSSALLWLEAHLFGPSPLAFSAVTLALVVASCLPIYAECSRHLSPWIAAPIALVPALHPATSEVIELMNRQPLALARSASTPLRTLSRHSGCSIHSLLRLTGSSARPVNPSPSLSVWRSECSSAGFFAGGPSAGSASPPSSSSWRHRS